MSYRERSPLTARKPVVQHSTYQGYLGLIFPRLMAQRQAITILLVLAYIVSEHVAMLHAAACGINEETASDSTMTCVCACCCHSSKPEESESPPDEHDDGTCTLCRHFFTVDTDALPCLVLATSSASAIENAWMADASHSHLVCLTSAPPRGPPVA